MTHTTAPRTWAGNVPTHCQLCDAPIDDAFSDFSSDKGWAIGCDDCVGDLSRFPDAPYGVGKGQRYRRVTYNGKTVWQKTAG